MWDSVCIFCIVAQNVVPTLSEQNKRNGRQGKRSKLFPNSYNSSAVMVIAPIGSGDLIYVSSRVNDYTYQQLELFAILNFRYTVKKNMLYDIHI